MATYAPALSRPSWRGRTNVDAITIAAIEYAERLAGHQFVITQGSYQGGNGDPKSAGTHDLGGVVDIRWTGDPRDVLALRKAGFAAWHRTPAQGPWPDHIHAVLIGHPNLADSAARQVTSYLRGMNGLKYERPDDGPRLTPIPRFTYPPEDDMAYTDWPEKDRKALIADVRAALLDAEIENRNAAGKVQGKMRLSAWFTNIERDIDHHFKALLDEIRAGRSPGK